MVQGAERQNAERNAGPGEHARNRVDTAVAAADDDRVERARPRARHRLFGSLPEPVARHEGDLGRDAVRREGPASSRSRSSSSRVPAVPEPVLTSTAARSARPVGDFRRASPAAMPVLIRGAAVFLRHPAVAAPGCPGKATATREALTALRIISYMGRHSPPPREPPSTGAGWRRGGGACGARSGRRAAREAQGRFGIREKRDARPRSDRPVLRRGRSFAELGLALGRGRTCPPKRCESPSRQIRPSEPETPQEVREGLGQKSPRDARVLAS